MKKSRFMIVAALLGLVISAAATGAEAARTVSVSGQCRRQVTPDLGSVTVTAEFRDLDLKVAASKAMAAYEKIRDGVKRLKLEALELTTSEYSLNQIREWEKNRTVYKGYVARMGLNVTSSSVTRLGEVLALAAREGIQEVGALQHFLSPAKRLEEQTACLEVAAKNARTKAEKLAQSLGATLGAVQTLSESWESPSPGPRMFMKSALSAEAVSDGPAPPSIEAGQETLSVTVQAAFELR